MIQNKLISLEKLNQGDKLFYREIYTSSILMRYVCEALKNTTADKHFHITLKKMAKKPAKTQLYVIKLLSPKTKVGVISIKWNQENNNCAEIGVIILKKYQRKKYAHRAKSLLMQLAFQQFKIKQLVAICEKENLAANLANQKLGFSLDQEFLDKTDNKVKIKWALKTLNNDKL